MVFSFLTGFFLKCPQNMDIQFSGNIKIGILFDVLAIFYGCASKKICFVRAVYLFNAYMHVHKTG